MIKKDPLLKHEQLFFFSLYKQLHLSSFHGGTALFTQKKTTPKNKKSLYPSLTTKKNDSKTENSLSPGWAEPVLH